MTDKASLWRNPSAVNWTLSPDYLGADKPEFKNTFILRCKSNDLDIVDRLDCRRRRRSAGRIPIPLDYDYDDYYQYNTSCYKDLNLQAGSGGSVEIDSTCECLYETNGCSCTPKNCSEHFWTQEYAGDGAYFTLEAYDVKTEKLQQMHCL